MKLLLALLLFSLVIPQDELSKYKRIKPQINLDSHYIDSISDLKMVFGSGFNDSINVFIGDSLVCKDFFKTNSSTGYTTKSISFSIKEKAKDSLFVFFPQKRLYCGVDLHDGYSRLTFHIRDNNNWVFNYSNKTYLLR